MRRGIAGAAVIWAFLLTGCASQQSDPDDNTASTDAQVKPTTEPWPLFVSVNSAGTLIQAGATVLDAREPDAFALGHIPGAQNAPWHTFVDGERNGLLQSDSVLESAVGKLGVSDDRPVVVYGLWQDGWGEEGRILWMLDYLGHTQVSIMEGGMVAWAERGGAQTQDVAAAAAGTFVARPRPEVRTRADALIDVVNGGGSVVILDTRDLAEYEGATPYGAARGGRIPGAKHFYWKDVFAPNGDLKSAASLRTRFDALGIADDTVVVSYCTGGVRSGFMYAAMRHAGYKNPRNYDGSWWEWSALNQAPIEGAPDQRTP